MGQNKQLPPCESRELNFVAIFTKVEVTAPDDAPIFSNFMRRHYDCKLIDRVEQGGLKTVIIYAQDCTAKEAVDEYQRIINEQRGYYAEPVEIYHEDEEGEEYAG